MGDYYRSKSYSDGRNEMNHYYIDNGKIGNTNFGATNNNGNISFQDLRCHSASYSYATSTTTTQQQVAQFPKVLKKGKSANATSSSSKAGWSFNDPEMQRRKRVASYKAYGVEGKLKRSFSKSFRWLKDRYSHMVHGW